MLVMVIYFTSTKMVKWSYYTFKNKYFLLKMNLLRLFSLNKLEILWNNRDSNGLCVSILIKYMEWYLVVIGKLHNEECLIYIFIREIKYDTPNILKNSHYNSLFKELRDQIFQLLLIIHIIMFIS